MKVIFKTDEGTYTFDIPDANQAKHDTCMFLLLEGLNSTNHAQTQWGYCERCNAIDYQLEAVTFDHRERVGVLMLCKDCLLHVSDPKPPTA